VLLVIKKHILKSIISYNINGINSAVSKGFHKWLDEEQPDILTLQEVRMNIELNQFNIGKYHGFWHPAQKKGYSGVAILSKNKPNSVVYGCGIEKYDIEGRILRLDFQNFSIISVYVPSGSLNCDRQQYKNDFLLDFFEYIYELKQKIPNLIVAGDFNIAHEDLDLYKPYAKKNEPKFLPHERMWISDFINLGFVDIFRVQNKEVREYSWSCYRRERDSNKGWRIDYHFVSNSIAKFCVKSEIMKDVFFSDHLPIKIQINL
jgi:exodeoxyribonuclease III